MRRAWVLAVTAAACSFNGGRLERSDTPGDAPMPDASTGAAIDGPVIGSCDPDPALVACYDFEGDVLDASGHDLHASTENVAFGEGKVGMAMQLVGDSAADVEETPLLDVEEITLEAWIRPSQVPTGGGRAGIIDNNGQWGMFVHANGRLQCNMINGPSMQIDAGITAGTWTHIACTYDGSSTRIYVDGIVVAMGTGGGRLATDGSTGISIAGDNPPGAGARFQGAVDQLRIFNVARSAVDICIDAQCVNW